MDDLRDSMDVESESPAQKQARLRRERREAKIKAGGSARLDQISQVSGRSAETAPTPSQPLAQGPALSSLDNDPDEVDIANHYQFSRSSNLDGPPIEADIRKLLRSAPQQSPDQQPTDGQEDPMVRMLQHLIGGIPGAEGLEQHGGLPAGLIALLGGTGDGAGGPGAAGQGQRGKENTMNAYFWKIIHAIFACVLGVYIVTVTTFNGAHFSTYFNTFEGEGLRGEGEAGGKRLFWVFATAEVVLQSSRFFLEKGTTRRLGFLGMATQVLPEPWKNYVELVSRYSGIWFTVVEDAMVVVFVMGLAAWWKGAVS
ncbi:MAG: hypothetical protein Q9212_000640 [Teloschistes hypoglaucus]